MTAAFNLSQLANNLNTSGQLDATDGLTGAVPIANGGTGQTTAANAINALLPSQTSNSGKYLTTNGTAASWADVAVRSGATATSSSTDITLTSSSNPVQVVTMTAAKKSVILPSAATMTPQPTIFQLDNAGEYGYYVKLNGTGYVDCVGNPFTLDFFGQVTSDVDNNIKNFDLSSTNSNQNGWGYGYSCYDHATITAPSATNNINVVPLSATSFIAAYNTQSNGGYVVVGTISGNAITFGTPVNVSGTNTILQKSLCALTSTYAAITTANRWFGLSISGTTITVSTQSSSFTINNDVIQVPITSTTTATITASGTRVITYSGTNAPTVSASTTAPAVLGSNVRTGVLIDTGKVLVVGDNGACIISISGTTITNGTGISSTFGTGFNTCFVLSTTEAIVFNNSDYQIAKLSVSGTAVSSRANANYLGTVGGKSVSLSSTSVSACGMSTTRFITNAGSFTYNGTNNIVSAGSPGMLTMPLNTSSTINLAIARLDATTAVAISCEQQTSTAFYGQVITLIG